MMGEVHGLGYYSEQAMESMHGEFLDEWQKDKLEEHQEDYAERLCKTITRIDGKHF